MDTYKVAIDRISDAVRDKEAWPDDTSKLQEQLDLLFVAVLSVGAEVPISRFPLTESSSLSSTALQGTTKKYDLPGDLFQQRDDNGIHVLDFDGEKKFPFQQIPFPSVVECGQNSIQQNEKLFAIDVNGNALYANNVTAAKLEYAQMFTKPTTTDYDTAGNFPLSEKDGQRAVHLVAYHVSGVTIRDSAAAQFHALLENEYTG